MNIIMFLLIIVRFIFILRSQTPVPTQIITNTCFHLHMQREPIVDYECPLICKDNYEKKCNWSMCQPCLICILSKQSDTCPGLCNIVQYRISDLFHHKFAPIAFKYKHMNVTGKDIAKWLHNCWPGSIMDRYVSKTDKKNDYMILNEIVSDMRSSSNVPKTIVHIRAGDTIFNASLQFHMSQTFSGHNLIVYDYDKNYYQKVILKLRKYNVTRISIVASTLHLANQKNVQQQNENMKYIHMVRNFFIKSKFNASLRINQGTPDEDFLYMSGANIFVQGGGGYSQLIARFVKYNGGIVI